MANIVVKLGKCCCSLLKHLADRPTRWSAHADAIHALSNGYSLIEKALETLMGDESQTRETHHDANGLFRKMKKFETVLLTVFWCDILSKFNKTSKYIQHEDANLQEVTNQLVSLSSYLTDIWNQFDDYESRAIL